MLASSRLRLWIMLAVALASSRVHGENPDVGRAKTLFERGEVHYRLGEFSQAVTSYREAMRLAPRPSILFNIAQCHRQLRHHSQALFYYRLYLADWQRANPGQPTPLEVEVQGHIARLAKVEGAGSEAPRAAPAVPPAAPLPPVAPADRGPRDRPGRRGLWLGLGLTTAGLALAAETAAIVCTVRARDRYVDEPEFGTYRSAAIATHVVAAVMAVTSVASWILYHRSRKAPPRRVSIELRPGGIAGAF